MKKIIKLTLVILCMALIFCFSSDNADASTKKSDGIIIKTCEFVLGRELTEEEKNEISHRAKALEKLEKLLMEREDA